MLICPAISFPNVPKTKKEDSSSAPNTLIYETKLRIEANYELYGRRQAIVEYPYGVIKRQWDFYYIMDKKASNMSRQI